MTIFDKIRSAFIEQKPAAPATLPALSLAYVGDTVYDLFVRTFLTENCDVNVNGLHSLSASLVCARGQAEAFFRVEPLLSEEETSVYKRGRNTHSGNVPKNAKLSDYRVATGFEALLGYLYLSGSDERLAVLMRHALAINMDSLLKAVPQTFK